MIEHFWIQEKMYSYYMWIGYLGDGLWVVSNNSQQRKLPSNWLLVTDIYSGET